LSKPLRGREASIPGMWSHFSRLLVKGSDPVKLLVLADLLQEIGCPLNEALIRTTAEQWRQQLEEELTSG
jgi:hypothetical protein